MAQVIAWLADRLAKVVDLVFQPVNESFHVTSDVLTSPKTHRALIRSIVLGGLLAFSTTLAVFAYLVFYWVYVPDVALVEDVHLQYGYTRPPFAFVDLPSDGAYLANDQAYDVSIDLFVPASDRNLDLGNFMVTFDLRSADNSSIFFTSRPASLNYASGPARVVQDLTNVRNFLGIRRAQAQYLTVRLASRKVLQRRSDTKLASYAFVEVGRADTYRDRATTSEILRGELQIYRCTVRFDAHFDGLRYLMYHHPIFSFVVFVAVFVAAQMSAALLSWLFVAYKRGSFSHIIPPPSIDKSEEKDEKVEIRRRMDQADAREQKERQRRRVESDLVLGRRMADEDSEVVESELEGGTTEVEEEDTPREGTDEERSSSDWQDVEDANVKREEDQFTIGGSSTSRGAASSLRSFAPTKTTSTSASTSRSAPRPPVAVTVESGTATPSGGGTEEQ